MTKIGANIKKIRTTKGLSQQAFADLFALTRGNISSYEENRAEPRLETVMQIANHFSIPLNQFVTQNLSIHEILKYLPHRYPLLLVDRVLSCEPGKSIVAIKNVTINEPYFVGHFPHHPVMPGVMII